MLLTITYTGENAADLGYLLHKNPSRPQTAVSSFGKIHIFYPEISANRCTAALLLDIDPLDLARGKPGSAGGGLFDYVNDRPYVSSSFMSTAISRVYGTAMSGRCEMKQVLADSALDLSATLVMLPCRGDTAMLEKVFAPLGYKVEWESGLLDDSFPEWGDSCYVNLTIRGKVRLQDLLRHIYVLIPVFDYRKHYWIGDEEVDKLLAHGSGWLEKHPEKNFITRRYFSKFGHFTKQALKRLDRLDNGEGGAENPAAESPVTEEEEASIPVKIPRLNDQRLLAVLGELKASGAQSVLDLGCGEGNLLHLLMKTKDFTAIAGMDVSALMLSRAAGNLKFDRMTEEEKKRVTLFQSSLCYRDKRFKNYDAAAIVEVIEHLDENRLPALEAVIFADASPATVIITTPNADYNVNYTGLTANHFRHGDHRFEWNRVQFRAWADSAATRHDYSVRYEDIGEQDANQNTPTQMAVFRKNTRQKTTAPEAAESAA
ncbi:MAG: 3' terminal RNA ribose 2'-O-methyltransferase Hen1 [Treponema sp.]|jgi:3' terminal RNA ribose 2'-O-methyltransferase Hen1|nr:3' terminal RNA ribose 2'-O-methyltransferase Hen1 [Treponema sp.]